MTGLKSNDSKPSRCKNTQQRHGDNGPSAQPYSSRLSSIQDPLHSLSELRSKCHNAETRADQRRLSLPPLGYFHQLVSVCMRIYAQHDGVVIAHLLGGLFHTPE